MIQLKRRISLLFIAIFISLALFGQDTDLYSKENIEEYAKFLFNSNQYTYAAEEYERLVFMDRQNENYQVGLLRSYRFAGEYDKGIRAFDLLHDREVKPGFDLIREYSKINLMGGNIGNLNLLIMDPTLDQDFRSNLDLTLRLISHPEYVATLEGLDDNLLDKGLLDLYHESSTLKYKSRFLAGSLSAVVPGLGKVYTGRWKDAFVSLLFVAGTGFQAYRAFSEKGVESVYGWIMGTLSLGFYIGNIYGSAKSARLYNNNQNLQYREKVIDHYINYY
jgi:uncharacterized membrane protein